MNPEFHHQSAPKFVAQICNLLYRRFPICGVSGIPQGRVSNHALPTPSRRYGRLKTCATHLHRLRQRSPGGSS